MDGLTDKGWLRCDNDRGMGLGYSLGYGCTIDMIGREFPSLGTGLGLAQGPGLGVGVASGPGLGVGSPVGGTVIDIRREVLWARYLEHGTKEIVRINATAR